MSLGNVSQCYTMVRERCGHTTERKHHVHTTPPGVLHVDLIGPTYALACLTVTYSTRGRVLGSVGVFREGWQKGAGGGGTHLGLPLLQQRLQPLLGGAALVVVTDYQDNVVPVEFPHQVEPDVGLVGVWRHRPQEGQVDALPRGPAIKCETWACINDLRLL